MVPIGSGELGLVSWVCHALNNIKKNPCQFSRTDINRWVKLPLFLVSIEQLSNFCDLIPNFKH